MSEAMEIFLSVYIFVSLLFGIIWFIAKLVIIQEGLCMPMCVFIWGVTDGLRLIPQIIITAIVAFIELPGEIATICLCGFSYVFIGLFYWVPWLIRRDRKNVMKHWKEHWQTNPFEFA